MRRYLSLLLGLAFSASAGSARAQECSNPRICDSGFCVDGVCCDSACDGECEACSAEAKGRGDDGVCEQVVPGTVCVASYCDENSFGFVPADTCDASGACIDGGPEISCFANDGICAKDLCDHDSGCGVVLAPDGYACGEGMACFDGVCDDAPPGTGGSGAGPVGEGGEGGSTGTGFGGAGPAVSGGSTKVSDCACRAAPGGRGDAAAGWLLSLLLLGWRRRS